MWILAIALLVGGAASMFCAFGCAMADGAEPTWVGPAIWGGLLAFGSGALLLFYLIITFAVSFWQR